ncbi:MAG: hypothetical protein ABJE47_05810 [bacterium]
MSGSLSGLTTFVKDAFAVSLADLYVPENIVIGEYTFLPWVRTGVVAGVTQARGAVRAEVTVSLDVQDDAAGSVPVARTLTVRGPGDVLGFDLSQIVRRYPVPGTPNAEDTFFAHVEFDRPDFPWMFTPFAPVADRLEPWLALVVLELAHADIRPGGTRADGAPLPATVRTRHAELQPLDESWAWAHAQVIGGPASGPPVASRLSESFAPVNLSRLICPRQLAPNTRYVACIVPAFLPGVQAALGNAPGNSLAPAWTRAAGDDENEITLPVFDHWSFGTTADGDFWSLAKKIAGIPAPWNVGRRIIDTSRPGGDIPELTDDEPGRVQVIRCALTAPSTAAKPADAPDDADTWGDTPTAALETQLNLPDVLAADFGGDANLPIVGPRIYARFQRAQNRVARAFLHDDWFHELNLVPTNRVIAGIGTRVVQKDREQLLQAAWAQVGAIDNANRDIRRAQAARYVGESLHVRHFSALPLGQLAQLTRAVQGKIRVDGGTATMLGTAARSATAPAALTGAFRRATRLRGPIARYLDAATRVTMSNIVGFAAIRDLRREYVEPDGIVSLSAKALTGISAETAARVLDVAVDVALVAAAVHTARFASLASSMDVLLSPPATWRPRSATLDIGGVVAAQVLTSLHAMMPTRITSQPSRADALGTLFEGLANSRTPAAASARESITNIGRRLPVRVLARSARAPAVRFDAAASVLLSTTIAQSRAVESDVLSAALSAFALGIGATDLPRTASRPPLTVERTSLLEAIHPKNTVTAHVKARFAARPSWLPPDWFDDGMVRPIMAAPSFIVPMYERLDAYDRDWLVPGLSKIPQNDFVTLLETNPKFTEAFLAGLSDEMGRELLFKGYPTDQRGTYFRRFWTAETDELAQDLHRFTPTPLGTHVKSAEGGVGRLVLVVRGELVKRYPDLMAMGLHSIPPVVGHPTFIDPESPFGPAIAPVLFHAFLAPDILLIGFDLTEADLVPDRWWFVLAEHPTAPRFGLQDGVLPPVGAHAGAFGKAILRDPIRAAYEASRLVAPARVGG